MDERSLITSIQLHDNRNAFAFLVRQYQSALRSYLTHLCEGDKAFADELAQEAFLKAYWSIGSFRGDSKFSTWLFQIARNLFFDSRRRNNFEQEISAEIISSPETRIDLDRSLHALDPADRELLILSYVKEFSHSEIAALTGVALGTIKSRITAARNRLAAMMMEEKCTGTI